MKLIVSLSIATLCLLGFSTVALAEDGGFCNQNAAICSGK